MSGVCSGHLRHPDNLSVTAGVRYTEETKEALAESGCSEVTGLDAKTQMPRPCSPVLRLRLLSVTLLQELCTVPHEPSFRAGRDTDRAIQPFPLTGVPVMNTCCKAILRGSRVADLTR